MELINGPRGKIQIGGYDDPSYKGGFKSPNPPQKGKKKTKNDIPHWAKGHRPRVDEDGKSWAQRLLDAKYGKGKWQGKGPGSEFSQIKKHGDNDFTTGIFIESDGKFQKIKKEFEKYNKDMKKSNRKDGIKRLTI